MAVQPISAIAEQQFRDIYLETFSQKQKLNGTFMEIHNAVGDAYKWPKVGNVGMVDRGSFGSLLTPSAIDHTQVTTTFEEKVSTLVVGRDEQTLLHPNERAAFARVQSDATGRELDQLQINEMDLNAGFSQPVGGSNLSLAKIIAVRERLIEENAITDGVDPLFLIHASQLSSMLNDPTITSTDFNSVRLLMAGTIDSFMGFRWIIYGNSIAGGLPISGTIRSCFAWTIDSMGYVFKEDPNMMVEWVPERIAWVSIAQFFAGTSVLQPKGVIKVLCDQSLA